MSIKIYIVIAADMVILLVLSLGLVVGVLIVYIYM
jgi:hypothetical protein